MVIIVLNIVCHSIEIINTTIWIVNIAKIPKIAGKKDCPLKKPFKKYYSVRYLKFVEKFTLYLKTIKE